MAQTVKNTYKQEAVKDTSAQDTNSRSWAKLLELNDNFRIDKDNRAKTDWQWFVYDNYVRGNQFIKYNPRTASVETLPSKGSQRFSVNKIYSTLRSVRGHTTKYDPKWEVYASDKSSASVSEAKYKQKVLDKQWYRGNLKPKVKDVVYDGLKYSVGILELGWDSEKDDVTFTIWDPFDVYFGGGTSLTDIKRVTKTVRRRLSSIEKDKAYKQIQGKLSATTDRFSSEYKQLLHDMTYGYANPAKQDEGTIVKETFELLDEPNSKGGLIDIHTFTDTAYLDHQESEYREFEDVFQVYHSDTNPRELYGEGWVKHLIPAQKAYNLLESTSLDYHHVMAKGRYTVPKNAGIRMITTENGQFIEHNPGRPPRVEPVPSMPASLSEQINRLNIAMEDLGGQHDASLGRIPTGATAGVAIDALQEGDSNNLRDLTDNLSIFLVGVARSIFKMYARYLDVTKIIKTDDKDQDGNPDYFAIIGENARVKPTKTVEGYPVVVIREDEEVEVRIGSWLGYTKEAVESRIYKHFTAGLIDQATALKALEYTDVDNIITTSIKEKVMNAMTKEGPPQEEPAPVNEFAQGEDTLPAMSEGAGIPMP